MGHAGQIDVNQFRIFVAVQYVEETILGCLHDGLAGCLHTVFYQYCDNAGFKSSKIQKGPGSEKWCAAKKDQSKSEWSASDARTYTMKCLIDGMAIGSEGWCEKLSDKPKGEWTGDKATSYAKHCVL